jgi:thiol-disulfide isomerase/thioredoxin
MKYAVAVYLSIFSFNVYAIDTAEVRIIIDAKLNTQKLSVSLNDGITAHDLQLRDNTSWKGPLYSDLGYLIIYYAQSDSTSSSRRLFFKKGGSKIYLSLPDNKDSDFSIDWQHSSNVVMYETMEKAVEFDNYLRPLYDSMHLFLLRYGSKMKSQEMIEKGVAIGDSLARRKFLFVQQHPEAYVSFFCFQDEISKSDYLSADSMLRFYNANFSDRYKGTDAAHYLEATMHNRIAISSRQRFPDFVATDTKNQEIKLSALKGKYVLIQLWASWCVPCIQELPALKSMNEKYKDKSFAFISFSIDKNLDACKKAIARYAMNWRQVMGDYNLYNALGVTSVPQVYLVDPEGKTIYNRTLLNDYTLNVLEKILATAMKK